MFVLKEREMVALASSLKWNLTFEFFHQSTLLTGEEQRHRNADFYTCYDTFYSIVSQTVVQLHVCQPLFTGTRPE
jgi:hypothetical protein